MFARGEGIPPNPVEALAWLELARRTLAERTWPDGDRMWDAIAKDHETISALLTASERAASLARSEELLKSDWNDALAERAVRELKSVQDYNDKCQRYGDIRNGVRAVYDLVAAELSEGRADLLICVAMIEWMAIQKTCAKRDPPLNEVLFYLQIIESMGSETSRLPAHAGVATALVIGGYCEPEIPSSASQQALFARLRQDYQRTLRSGAAMNSDPP